MQTTSRRDLLAGLASLAALAGLAPSRTEPEAGVLPAPAAAPGLLRVAPPSDSVMRRG